MRRALLVGIDAYPGVASSLHGCVNDATTLSDVLGAHEDGSPNFACETLLSSKGPVHRATLRARLDALFGQPADVALFYFSGHGSINNLGGYLVTQDAKRYDEGVAMRDVLTLATRSPVEEVVVILDCCHAGAFGNPPDVDNTVSLREGVSVLTASRASQLAMEVNAGGVFTALVNDALDGGASDVCGNVTVASVYSYVDLALGAWDQRPLFKAHVSRFTPLRRCRPFVEPEVLRRLWQYFPTAGHELPLDPSYEPTSGQADPERCAVFEHLQQLRAARLVVPVGERHLYYAAMNRKPCRLTALGRFYWSLTARRRI